jgi:hypothetical protein
VKTRMLCLLLLVAAPASALAKPYRLIQARAGHQTGAGDLELGLRYDGLLDGDGVPGFHEEDFHQIAFSLRWGVLDRLELEAQASVIVWHEPGKPSADVDPGDVKLGAQVQIIREWPHILAGYFGLTLPTAPSNPALPPQFADGTLDFEALLIYELAPGGGPVRLVFDAGWQFLGKYKDIDWDVPDAFRYDAALAIAAGSRVQLSLELNGRYHTDRVLTPVWTDNQHILELTPGLRIEITPRWVFEGGAGIALNDDTRSMYRVHVLAGVTYEFPIY